MQFYVGTSGYSYPKWKGSFYPPKLPQKEMLSYYAERFASVEINNSFYRMPAADVLKSWVKHRSLFSSRSKRRRRLRISSGSKMPLSRRNSF